MRLRNTNYVFDIHYPDLRAHNADRNAGMAMIARPALAAAVCEAGGLGTIGSDINPPDALRNLVRQTKALTKRPFGVDLIGDFVTDEHISVLVEEQVALAIFFWTLPTVEHVERLQRARVKVWMQIGRVVEAEQAVALDADALIVQGAEAGGHNRAEASTMTLFPRIRRRFPGLPLLAAGGIVDGATMAAALVLGADAVWCGSRFLASEEAEAHDAYKDRVLSADVGDTAILSIYGPEWPGQAMRAVVNDGARVALGREPEAIGDAVGQIIGSTVLNGQTIPVPRYSAILPTRDFDGDIEQACLTAGQSAGNIDEILPAGEIVRRMTSEAKAALNRLVTIREDA
jgi:NAD(P)H-dependent flavin oxidoreductase YrpB (nitropropane dioxygenase family)